MISITVNGDRREIAAGTTIADLVAELKLQPKFVAIERNEQLVPRTRHSETAIVVGDRIEIVTLVGGG